MAGIAKPTKDFKFNVKTAGKTRVWNGSYEMRESGGKTTVSLGIAESSFPLESASVGKTWSREGIAIETNLGVKWPAPTDSKEREKKKTQEEDTTTPSVPRAQSFSATKYPTYDASVTMRTSKWFYLLPPLLLSASRRGTPNKPTTTYRAGVQLPYANDTRTVLLEGSWRPETNLYSGRVMWFWNSRAFVGVEASSKKSCFAFAGSPFLAPQHSYFQGPVWKELRSHMILFTTMGIRNGDFQFGVHMTWK